jgi:hypothetical protein
MDTFHDGIAVARGTLIIVLSTVQKKVLNQHLVNAPLEDCLDLHVLH